MRKEKDPVILVVRVVSKESNGKRKEVGIGIVGTGAWGDRSTTAQRTRSRKKASAWALARITFIFWGRHRG